jgi:MSHA pilin protein MshA
LLVSRGVTQRDDPVFSPCPAASRLRFMWLGIASQTEAVQCAWIEFMFLSKELPEIISKIRIVISTLWICDLVQRFLKNFNGGDDTEIRVCCGCLEVYMRKRCGFSLIDLVMVIVILGILAASAIPSFVDVSSDTKQTAVDGVAGALGSASAINYAVRSIGKGDGIKVEACTDIANALEGGLDAGYQIVGTIPNCSVRLMSNPAISANFVGHAIP